MKLLFCGDWHIRGTNPRNRIDDYGTALKLKLREVFDLAKQHKVEAIVTPGDTFDRPECSISVLLDYVSVLNESPVPIYTTPGNHDVYGFNIDTYGRTSLKLLEMLVSNFTVRTDTTPIYFTEADVWLTLQPYTREVDVYGYGYDPGYDIPSDVYTIHVVHGMLLDHVPPFDRYSLLKDVKTRANTILTGHDHTGYGVYTRQDGKLFCNPGSLTRLSASTGELERTIQVALIDVRGKTCSIDLVPLKSAKPGPEVLDRSRIEAEQQRQYAMEQFAALIQTDSGEKVLIDIDQIIEQIAAAEGLAPDVVKKALEAITAQREGIA